MKTCFKCHESKPVNQFYKHPQMADGRLGKCKECTKADVRKYRRENDSVREYDRKRSRDPARMEQRAITTKLWAKKNPEKKRASSAVSNALRDGRLKKKPCEECGTTRNVHGHHDDYSKPLDVRWLCALHHRRRHADMERETT